MEKIAIKYSQDFLDDISEIVLHIANVSGSIEVARRFYAQAINAIENRSFGADSYEKYQPYKNSPEYYRIYFGNYIIFYVVNNGIMDVRRMLWSGVDISGKIKQ